MHECIKTSYCTIVFLTCMFIFVLIFSTCYPAHNECAGLTPIKRSALHASDQRSQTFRETFST